MCCLSSRLPQPLHWELQQLHILSRFKRILGMLTPSLGPVGGLRTERQQHPSCVLSAMWDFGIPSSSIRKNIAQYHLFTLLSAFQKLISIKLLCPFFQVLSQPCHRHVVANCSCNTASTCRSQTLQAVWGFSRVKCFICVKNMIST